MGLKKKLYTQIYHLWRLPGLENWTTCHRMFVQITPIHFAWSFFHLSQEYYKFLITLLFANSCFLQQDVLFLLVLETLLGTVFPTVMSDLPIPSKGNMQSSSMNKKKADYLFSSTLYLGNFFFKLLDHNLHNVHSQIFLSQPQGESLWNV